MSSMTGPVSGAKGKKNWEQLQQETDNSDGVQVKRIIHIISQCNKFNYDDASGSDNAEEGWKGRGRGEESPGGQ